jgi:acetyltransferase
LEAAFRRTGVLRVNDIAELFHMAEILEKQPRPTGRRLAILTNAGGPAVLATDALIAAGGELAALSDETQSELGKVLPPQWSRGNPVDVLGDAGPERYSKALEIMARDPNSDGLLVILTPQDMTDPTRTAEALQKFSRLGNKPVFASWMGGGMVAAGVDILNRAHIPTFSYPDSAARAFCFMWRYTYSLRGLYETPTLAEGGPTEPQEAASMIRNVLDEGRTLLDEYESKKLLAAYGIPIVETRAAGHPAEAVAAARALGYPVVLKLLSRSITHKTDVGGVKLDLRSDAEVEAAFAAIRDGVERRHGSGHFDGVTVQRMVRLPDAYELIIGSTEDAQFGPVLLFGAGGQLVEVFRDRALALPPLNETLARRMLEQTRVYSALRGVRGRRPVDVAALERLLVRFSQLVVEQRRIREIDINPLFASPEGLVAVDARVLLFGPEITDSELPASAIRPYPSQYAGAWRMKDGSEVLIRPIRPEDEPQLVDFHHHLSERSVRFRYFQPLHLDQRTAHERLIRVCFSDYDRDVALVAERRNAAREREIIGVGRLSKIPGQDQAEFAMLIADEWHHRGLGTELLRRLVEIGKNEGLSAITADILRDNVEMQRVCEKVGFELRHELGEPTARAAILL